MELILIIAIAILIIKNFAGKNKQSQKTTYTDSPSVLIPEEKNEPSEIDYTTSYQAKYLLTKNEWYQHKKLKEIADTKGYVICPKVRLLDIVEPRKGEKKYKTLLYKIQAKHVDFLICDNDMHIKAIIELDDNSHNIERRIERDEFVDTILKSVGYKVIHTKYITPDILDNI